MVNFTFMSANEQKLSEVIKEVVDVYKLNDKLNEVQVVQSWNKVAGKAINIHTTGLYMKKSILYVKLDSPALKTELSYLKTKIMLKINKSIGKNIIEDIVFF